ncbi:hypothetical protein [Aeromonas veronii]|uniref:hypothetical protein n=1 Tax=Aeromonas veronii TaxID=654 RepID=UPI003D226A6E
MFKPNNVALMVAALLGATTAYAATKSAPTEMVVGFKPVYTNKDGTGAVSGELKLGGILTVDPEKLGYDDKDGDLHDLNEVKFSWKVDDTEIGNERTLKIPEDKTLTGKAIVLAVTPVSQSGDPLFGDALVLTDLLKAGATGGDGNGNIIDNKAKPFVTNLQLAGALKQGEELTATYTFVANGGNTTDKSNYAWGKRGQTVVDVIDGEAELISHPAVTTSGQVPAYRIEAKDAGEVLELSLRAANAAGVIGNTITVDSTGKVTDIGGGTGDGGNIIDPNGDGKIPYIKADPQNAGINFKSSATDELNGIVGIRPVAGVDVLTATIVETTGASPYADDYTFRWFADDVEVEPATKGANTFTPRAEHQGKIITVEVEPVK